MPTCSIYLNEQLYRFVEHQVSSGGYRNPSEVVREALRLLEEKEQVREAKLKVLRKSAKQGFDEIDQGKGGVLNGEKPIYRYKTDIEDDNRADATKDGQ